MTAAISREIYKSNIEISFPCHIHEKGSRGGKNPPCLCLYQELCPRQCQHCALAVAGASGEQQSEICSEQSHHRAILVTELALGQSWHPQGTALGVLPACILWYRAVQSCKLMLNLAHKHTLFLECFESRLALKIRCKKGGVGGQRVLILSIIT